MRKNLSGILGTLAFAAGAVASANAELIVGLGSVPGSTLQQLVQFDSATPGSISNTSPVISGAAAGDRIVDIDYYPVNGLLHGMGATGNLYRIDPNTGVSVLDVTPQSSLGGPQDADFNPAADRLRVASAGNQNFRITPSVNTGGSTGASAGLVTADGTYVYVGGSPTPDLVSNAYTNNFDGTATTTLYSIDTGTDGLVLHTGGPAFSTLNVVGPLGLNVGRLVGFDVSGTGAAFASDGNAFYTISLASGALSSVGLIGTPLIVETIAAATVVPEPAGIAALLAGAALMLRRRS